MTLRMMRGSRKEGATVQEGTSGIARGYQYDRQDAEAKTGPA